MPPEQPAVPGNNSEEPQTHQARERVIALLAARQHGIVATWQLCSMGFTSDDISYRVKLGRLHRIRRGVYAVGHRSLAREGHWMAAVLAYGPGAVLSHRTAAAVWHIGRSAAKIHVTTAQSRRSRPGTKAHSGLLHPEDMTTRERIPVTSVARTIFDLAPVLDLDELARLLEEADRAQVSDLAALDRVVARRPRAPGSNRLRTVLADYRGPVDTRSNHERALRKLIKAAGLPEPQYNVIVAGFLVDAYWSDSNLVVEVDSSAYHLTPRAFEADRIRDAQLQKVGYRVLRITEKRLYGDPAGVIADIIALLR